MTNCRAYEYCKSNYRKKTTPKYVKAQMREFMSVCRGEDERFVISETKVRQIENILKLLIMPKGLKAGTTLYECSVGYQWLIYTAALATVYRDDPNRRRYETVVLEIGRKNFKTYTVATLFILLFLTEPKFSKFYSVAPDGALSREIREAISETLRSSPLVYTYNENPRFRILRDYILYKPTQITYTPLSYSTSRMDGRLPSVFCADEVGALPSNYAIEAMQSGQLNVKNKLGFIISTKYPTIQNPFEDECSYSKRVLDGIEADVTRFSLLYEPDDPKRWETSDLILQHANPVAMEIPEIWDDLVKKRNIAIAVESKRENFLCKHCNIIYQGAEGAAYVDIADLHACKTASIDWRGRVVYVGVDLSLSDDNTAVSFVSIDDDETILANSFAFVPEGQLSAKSVREKVDYFTLAKAGHVIPCGDRTIDYKTVEDFVLKLEDRFGVEIQAIGYDRWNALSSAQKWDAEGYKVVEVRQHSSVLHPATKLLREKIINQQFRYEENKMLEINFSNARCVYDTNKNQYVNKRKSTGKIDMVAAMLNAVYLLQQDVIFNHLDFSVQVL